MMDFVMNTTHTADDRNYYEMLLYSADAAAYNAVYSVVDAVAVVDAVMELFRWSRMPFGKNDNNLRKD